MEDPIADQDTAASYEYQGPLTQEVVEARILEQGVLHTADDGSEYGVLPPEVVLASITTPDGRDVTFTWDSVTNGIGYSERAVAGVEPLFPRETGILERYVALTTPESPVPLPLVELDDTVTQQRRTELVGHRDTGFVVDAVASSAMPGGLGDGAILAAAPTNSCVSGIWFRDTHCWYENNGLILPNFGDPIHACDNGEWHALNRSTGDSARKNTHSTAAACGTDVRVGFWFKAWGTWWQIDEDQIIPDDNVHYKTRLTGAWWRRKIEYRRLDNTGFLRAESIFGN